MILLISGSHPQAMFWLLEFRFIVLDHGDPDEFNPLWKAKSHFWAKPTWTAKQHSISILLPCLPLSGLVEAKYMIG
jgi:hypothetical protein